MSVQATTYVGGRRQPAPTWIGADFLLPVIMVGLIAALIALSVAAGSAVSGNTPMYSGIPIIGP